MAAAPLPRASTEQREELRALALRHQGPQLAGERFVPLLPPLAALLALPGLQRGSTVLIENSPFPGSTALALALLAAASSEGLWCAVLGLPELGLAAAAELGVCLERLVLVPDAGGREAMFLGTLLEGCDVVCATLQRPLPSLEARRLTARARERRGVLLLLPRRRKRRSAPSWPEGCDLTLTVTGGSFVGLGAGEGRLAARRLEVAARRRRGGAARSGALWLPAADGRIVFEEPDSRGGDGAALSLG
ncbi:MAG TPA: hypothetical protein VNF07_12525 [Acidimicrobiales bacterium]|nr:hypothetical protein [Acidimicrobiales bacterium]